MEQTLNTAIKIVTKLISGEEVSRINHSNLYEAYISDSDVYDYVNQFMEGFQLELIDDYGDGLYVSSGMNNKVFGYSNEELRKRFKINNNSELYVMYFLIYGVIIQFYSDSSTPTYKTYILRSEIVSQIDNLLRSIVHDMDIILEEDRKGTSFKQIAMVWDNLPTLTVGEFEDINKGRTSSNSKVGYVKKLMQFLKEEMLFIEENDMYYPTNRFHALAQSYFRKKGSDIYELLNREERNIDA